MGKQRRPSGPRPTRAKAVPDESPAATTESPPVLALPAAEPTDTATAALMRAATPAEEAEEPAPVEAAGGDVGVVAAESPPALAEAPPAAEPWAVPEPGERVAADRDPTAVAGDSPPEASAAPPATGPAAAAADEPAHAVADAEGSPPVVSAAPEPFAPAAPVAPVRPPATGFRMAFAPERLDLTGIGATITGYMRGEGEAAAAYIRALGDARTPADMIRLQVGEFQRAADASLTCWSTVAQKASRAFASR